MELAVGAALAIAVAVGGYILLVKGLWDLIKPLLRRFRLIRPSQEPATAEQAEEARALLEEIKAAVTPAGTDAPDTDALAAAATANTAAHLQEAIDLQAQRRERDAINVLLEAFRRDLGSEAHAQLHRLIGNSFLNLSALEEAEGHYRQSLDASRLADSRDYEAAALGNLGLVYGQQGDLDRAERHHRDALDIHREIGNGLGEANGLGNLGIVYGQQGDFDRAKQHHRDALDICREIGDRIGEANQLGNLGNVYRQQDDLDRAEQHHRDALDIHREVSDRLGEAASRGNLGNVYRQQGDFDRAEQHLRDSLDICREIGDRIGEANQLGNLGIVYGHQGDFDRAEQHLRDALDIHHEIGDRIGEAYQLGNLGLFAEGRGEPGEACVLLGAAAAIYADTGAGGPGPDTVRAALEDLGCEDEPADD